MKLTTLQELENCALARMVDIYNGKVMTFDRTTQYKNIYKSLQALEIIKEKIWFDFDDNRLRVDIWTKSEDEMLLYSFVCKDLQEYKLLKEVLL